MKSFYKIIIIFITAVFLQAGCYASDDMSPLLSPDMGYSVDSHQQKTEKIKPAMPKIPPPAKIASKPLDSGKLPTKVQSEKQPEKTDTSVDTDIENYENSILEKAKIDDEKIDKEAMKKEITPKSESSFIAKVFDMLKVLFNVLLLILVLALILYLFKKMKNANQSTSKTVNSQFNEPRNENEAISSFVRHRLNK